MISFVLFPQAWLPSMNLNISKLVYWEVRKYEIMTEIIEEMMEHYTEVSLDVLQYINHNNTLFVIIISKTALTCEENKKELIIRNTWIKVSNLRIMGVYDVTTSSRTVHKSEMSFRTGLLKLLSLSNQKKHGQSLKALTIDDPLDFASFGRQTRCVLFSTYLTSVWCNRTRKLPSGKVKLYHFVIIKLIKDNCIFHLLFPHTGQVFSRSHVKTAAFCKSGNLCSSPSAGS